MCCKCASTRVDAELTNIVAASPAAKTDARNAARQRGEVPLLLRGMARLTSRIPPTATM